MLNVNGLALECVVDGKRQQLCILILDPRDHDCLAPGFPDLAQGLLHGYLHRGGVADRFPFHQGSVKHLDHLGLL